MIGKVYTWASTVAARESSRRPSFPGKPGKHRVRVLLGSEGAVQVEGGADQRQVRERLGEIAERLAL